MAFKAYILTYTFQLNYIVVKTRKSRCKLGKVQLAPDFACLPIKTELQVPLLLLRGRMNFARAPNPAPPLGGVKRQLGSFSFYRCRR